MIPGGLTRYLQPLDVSINKPFKDELRKKYTDYWMETKNSNAKVSQNDLINWVWEVWYSKSISSNMIRKSFKAAGITLNLDGSKDEMFVANSKLLENDQEMVYEDEQPIYPNELIEKKKNLMMKMIIIIIMKGTVLIVMNKTMKNCDRVSWANNWSVNRWNIYLL